MHKDLKKIKPTMRIVSRSKVKDTPGIIQGQTVRPLCGAKQTPSERIRVGLAQFKPNLHEHLHWHARRGHAHRARRRGRRDSTIVHDARHAYAYQLRRRPALTSAASRP